MNKKTIFYVNNFDAVGEYKGIPKINKEHDFSISGCKSPQKKKHFINFQRPTEAAVIFVSGNTHNIE